MNCTIICPNCVQLTDSQSFICQVYSSQVCKIDRQTGAFVRLYWGYKDDSPTTVKYVNKFRALHGLDPLNKAKWNALPRD